MGERNVRYRFHRCRPHARCPNLTGWYLELRPDDVDTLMKLHKGVVRLYFFKFGMDPHIEPDGPYNPIKLAAAWLQSVERYLMNGETLLVNSNGGIMPMDGVKVLETVESDDICWDNRYDDEIITVSRWPQARHWYLCVAQVVYRILKVASLSKTGPSKQPNVGRPRDGGSRMLSADRRPHNSERHNRSGEMERMRPPLCVPSPPKEDKWSWPAEVDWIGWVAMLRMPRCGTLETASWDGGGGIK